MSKWIAGLLLGLLLGPTILGFLESPWREAEAAWPLHSREVCKCIGLRPCAVPGALIRYPCNEVEASRVIPYCVYLTGQHLLASNVANLPFLPWFNNHILRIVPIVSQHIEHEARGSWIGPLVLREYLSVGLESPYYCRVPAEIPDDEFNAHILWSIRIADDIKVVNCKVQSRPLALLNKSDSSVCLPSGFFRSIFGSFDSVSGVISGSSSRFGRAAGVNESRDQEAEGDQPDKGLSASWIYERFRSIGHALLRNYVTTGVVVGVLLGFWLNIGVSLNSGELRGLWIGRRTGRAMIWSGCTFLACFSTWVAIAMFLPGL